MPSCIGSLQRTHSTQCELETLQPARTGSYPGKLDTEPTEDHSTPPHRLLTAGPPEAARLQVGWAFPRSCCLCHWISHTSCSSLSATHPAGPVDGILTDFFQWSLEEGPREKGPGRVRGTHWTREHGARTGPSLLSQLGPTGQHWFLGSWLGPSLLPVTHWTPSTEGSGG